MGQQNSARDVAHGKNGGDGCLQTGVDDDSLFMVGHPEPVKFFPPQKRPSAGTDQDELGRDFEGFILFFCLKHDTMIRFPDLADRRGGVHVDAFFFQFSG